MGFIKAFTDALGGTFADQWKDYYQPMPNVPMTAGVIPAVPVGQNNNRGANISGSTGIITNGSKILVPEGYALITVQDGEISGCIMEAGGFIYNSDDPNSKSIFAGDGIMAPLVTQTWERFKMGGQPAANQLALYVNMKEIPNNRFGTQSEIYWDDAYLNVQAGALARGSYTLKIVDPLLFVKRFVPATTIQNGQVFDFADMDNAAGTQLFNEVVGSLAQAFSIYTNDVNKGNRITKIQSDPSGLGEALSQAVEEGFAWKSDRGLIIEKVAIASIEYDEATKAILQDVRKADSLMGARGDSFLKSSIGRGLEAAGSNEGGGAMGMAFMGMGANAAGGIMGGFNNQQPAAEDPIAKLEKLKTMLDKSLITQEEYDKAKTDILGKM